MQSNEKYERLKQRKADRKEAIDFVNAVELRDAFTQALSLPPRSTRFRVVHYADHPEWGRTFEGAVLPTVALRRADGGEIVPTIDFKMDNSKESDDVEARLMISEVAKHIILKSESVAEVIDNLTFLADSPYEDYLQAYADSEALGLTELTVGSMTKKGSTYNGNPNLLQEGMNRYATGKIVDLIGTNGAPDDLNAIAEWLDSGTCPDSIVRSLETAIGMCFARTDLNHSESVVKFIEVLHDRGLLREIESTNSIVTRPDLVAKFPAIAAILQDELSRRPTDDTKRNENLFNLLSRKIMHKLLERYQTDASRNTENVAKILKFIFPEEKRKDTMSRNNLFSLANRINEQTRQAESFRNYSVDGTGMVADAFRDTLSITRSVDSSALSRAQELEDELYSNIIGMMLEQRNVATVALQSIVSIRE